jgi:hypothetical protein
MMGATDEQAEAAIAILERAIEAARNGNQAGENAVVKAAAALARPSEQKERPHVH